MSLFFAHRLIMDDSERKKTGLHIRTALKIELLN